MGTLIDIINHCCENHNMTYIAISTNSISCNGDFPMIKRTNVWIISIGRKKSTTVQKVMEAVSS